MTFALIAALAAHSADQKPLVCAVMTDNAVNSRASGIEYAGVKYTFCCGMCPSAFTRNPAKYVKAAEEGDIVVGTSLFDPVSGARVDIKTAKFSSDFHGCRYFFSVNEDKSAFDAAPAKFTKTPDKESLVCAMSGEKIADYGSSAGYADYDGVRYYACCSDCLPAMKKDLTALKTSKAVISTPKAIMGKNNEAMKMGGGK